MSWLRYIFGYVFKAQILTHTHTHNNMHELVQGITSESQSQATTSTKMTELLLYYLDKGEDFTWGRLGIHARDVPCIPHHIYYYNNSSYIDFNQDCIESLNENCGFGSEKYGCIFFQVWWANIILLLTTIMIAVAMAKAIAVLLSTTALTVRSLLLSISHAITTPTTTTTATGTASMQPAILLFYFIFYYVSLRHHQPHNSQSHHFHNYTPMRPQYLGICLLLAISTTVAGAFVLLDPIDRLIIQQTAKQMAWDNILYIFLW